MCVRGPTPSGHFPLQVQNNVWRRVPQQDVSFGKAIRCEKHLPQGVFAYQRTRLVLDSRCCMLHLRQPQRLPKRLVNPRFIRDQQHRGRALIFRRRRHRRDTTPCARARQRDSSPQRQPPPAERTSTHRGGAGVRRAPPPSPPPHIVGQGCAEAHETKPFPQRHAALHPATPDALRPSYSPAPRCGAGAGVGPAASPPCARASP